MLIAPHRTNWNEFIKPNKLKVIFTLPSIVFSTIFFKLGMYCSPCPAGAECVPCAPIFTRFFLWFIVSIVFLIINHSYSSYILHLQQKIPNKIKFIKIVKNTFHFLCLTLSIFIIVDLFIDKIDWLFIQLSLTFFTVTLFLLTISTLEMLIYFIRKK